MIHFLSSSAARVDESDSGAIYSEQLCVVVAQWTLFGTAYRGVRVFGYC